MVPEDTTTLDYSIFSTERNNETEADVKQYYYYYYPFEDFEWIWKFYSVQTLVVCVLGIIGNFIAMAVSLRKNMRGMSSSMFILFLSIADNISLFSFLFSMIGSQYVRSVFSPAYCKSLPFVKSFGTMLSGWTVLLMSFERMVIVTFPLKAPHWTSRKRVLIAEGILVFFLFLHGLHFIWTKTMMTYPNPFCQSDKEKYGDFLRAYTIYDGVMSAYIQIVFIFIFNAVIIVQLAKARKTQKAMSSGTASTGSQNKNSSNRITIMLTSVSVAFLICVTPQNAFQVYLTYIRRVPENNFWDYVYLAMTSHICLFIWELNYGMNIILYSLTGRKFRNEMINMFTCGKFGGPKSSSSKATASRMTATTRGNSQTSVSNISSKVC